MWFSTFIFANVINRPIRSTLTVVGVAVAVGAVVSLLGVVRGLERSLLDLYQQRGIDLLVYQSGKVQITASSLPEKLGERISQLDNVAEASPVLSEVLSLIENDLVGVSVQGWQPDSFMMRDLTIESGRKLTDDDRRQVLLGAALAAVAKKQVGDTMELMEGESFTVAGIYRSYNVFDNGAAVTSLHDLQDLMLRDNEVTLFTVVAKDHSAAAVSRLQEDIRGITNGLQVSEARELAERSSEIRMARSFAWMTSAIALLIGSIGMLNTMLMAVFERTKEIAMLRALGWRKRRIVSLVLGEATLLSLIGAFFGSLGAIVMVRLLSKIPETGRVISANVSFDVILEGFVIAVLLGICGGLFPAWKASRLLPVEGLRHD